MHGLRDFSTSRFLLVFQSSLTREECKQHLRDPPAGLAQHGILAIAFPVDEYVICLDICLISLGSLVCKRQYIPVWTISLLWSSASPRRASLRILLVTCRGRSFWASWKRWPVKHSKTNIDFSGSMSCGRRTWLASRSLRFNSRRSLKLTGWMYFRMNLSLAALRAWWAIRWSYGVDGGTYLARQTRRGGNVSSWSVFSIL